jgi:nucleotide-binding universal stress UspA family protein
MERIVVGVDGAESSRSALAWAAEQARNADARLVVVHAWTVPANAYGSWLVPNFDPRRTQRAFRSAAEAVAERAIEGVDLDGVEVDLRVVENLAADALVEESVGATMVVLGHRGRGPLAELVLGSTTKNVQQRAGVPVVVVPQGVPASAAA